MHSHFRLNGTLVSFINKHTAHIVLANQETIEWPRELLPQGVHVGENIFLTLETKELLEQHQKNVAKQVLNQLLQA